MLLKSLEGLPNGAHVSVNFKDVKDLGLDLKVDPNCPDYRPVRVQIGKLRAALAKAEAGPKKTETK